MISIQDRYIGISKIEKALIAVNADKSTYVCSSDIAQYFDEYYPELFENIASNDKAYALFNYRMETIKHYSYSFLASEHLANYDNLNNYSPFKTLADYYGYDSFNEMNLDYLVFYDSALDGFIVFDY